MDDRDRSVSPEVLDPSSDFTNTFHDDDDGFDHPPPGLVRDLETRAITVSQLIQEVKGIYAGLGMFCQRSLRLNVVLTSGSHG